MAVIWLCVAVTAAVLVTALWLAFAVRPRDTVDVGHRADVTAAAARVASRTTALSSALDDLTAAAADDETGHPGR